MRRFVVRASAWALALMMLLTPSAYASEEPAPAVGGMTLSQVQQRDDELTIYVNMTDAAGGLLSDSYSAEQFSISVDGDVLNVASVETFDPNVYGTHYVFSVDVSTTVSPAMMRSVHEAMYAFVDQLGPLDTVSILTFGWDIKVRIVNSSDRDAIKAAIDGIAADEGMTALYKGVIDAVDIASKTDGRSAVIVITDGANDPTKEMSVYTKDSITAQVQSAQVPLFGLGLSDAGGADTESLADFAAMTGGKQYVTAAAGSAGCLDDVRARMYNTVVLHADLVNTQGKTGFDAASTFIVGFQPENGAFVKSNELQQNINWQTVPLPAAAVTPTPIPQIALELDEQSVEYSTEKVNIDGLVTVEQGVVNAEDLTITVGGEAWLITALMRNGNDYTFTAEGKIPSDAESLEVRAEIKSMGVASRIQRVSVLRPEATPAPVISVELDESARDMLFEPGKTVTISGVINVQGEIETEDLRLFINGAAVDMTVMKINSEQYEFSSDVTLQPDATGELTIQVQLEGKDIFSRAQRLFLVTPAPTAEPVLLLSLNESSVEYEQGEPITVKGNIEISSGEIDPADLALYVNKVRWDMEVTPLSDGTYGFEAVNSLADGDVEQLEVRVRLQDQTQVASNQEMLAVTTPEPPATPVPTQRPGVTPPPTRNVPVLSAVEQPDPREIDGSGLVWYLIGGAVVLVLAVVLIILFKKKKEKPVKNPDAGGPTIRDIEDDDAQAPESGTESMMPDNGTFSDERTITTGAQGYLPEDNAGDGTGRMSYAPDTAEERSGTVRLDPDEEIGGTVRIDMDEEEGVFLAVTIEQTRRHETYPARTVHIGQGEQVMIGQAERADVVIDDVTVSGEHLMLSFDGQHLSVKDMDSTNGTKVNGEKLPPYVPKEIKDGDSVLIGRTTLKFRFGESESY